MLHQLINRLPTSWLPCCVYCPIVGDDVCYELGESGSLVAKHVDRFTCIILAPSCQESGQPELPVTNYLRTIFPLDGFSQINVQVSQVEKCPVKQVHRVFRVVSCQCLRGYFLCSFLQPLLGCLVLYVICDLVNVQFPHDGCCEVCLKCMYNELIAHIEHLH